MTVPCRFRAITLGCRNDAVQGGGIMTHRESNRSVSRAETPCRVVFSSGIFFNAAAALTCPPGTFLQRLGQNQPRHAQTHKSLYQVVARYQIYGTVVKASLTHGFVVFCTRVRVLVCTRIVVLDCDDASKYRSSNRLS